VAGSAPASHTDGAAGPAAPRLLEVVRERIRYRHLSYRTEQADAGWIRRYIGFHGRRHPREMGAPEIESFLNHLANERNVAASTHNQALSALLILYGDVPGVELPWLGEIERPKRPSRLPVVLSRDAVRALLAQLDGLPARLAALLYGTGLRLMECVRLRVKDLDLDRREILVRQGKGGKDRMTMVPRSLVSPLRRQLARAVWAAARAAGLPGVELPGALASKCPRAGESWGWFWVFPASEPSRDPRWGIRRTPPPARGVAAAREQAGRGRGADRQAGDHAHAAPRIRHPPARVRLRLPYRAGTARPSRRVDDDALHARPQPRRPGRAQPTGLLIPDVVLRSRTRTRRGQAERRSIKRRAALGCPEAAVRQRQKMAELSRGPMAALGQPDPDGRKRAT